MDFFELWVSKIIKVFAAIFGVATFIGGIIGFVLMAKAKMAGYGFLVFIGSIPIALYVFVMLYGYGTIVDHCEGGKMMTPTYNPPKQNTSSNNKSGNLNSISKFTKKETTTPISASKSADSTQRIILRGKKCECCNNKDADYKISITDTRGKREMLVCSECIKILAAKQDTKSVDVIAKAK